MKFRMFAGAAVSVALLASTAAAQVCQGDLSFRSGSPHVGGAIGITDHTTTYGGDMAFGHATGVYGGGSLGLASYDGYNGTGVVVGGGIGYAMPLANRSAWQLCPGATLTLGFGPSADAGGTTIHTSQQALTLGASVGRALPLNRSVTLLPFGSAALGHTTVHVSGGGASGSASDTYLVIGFGAGIQLSPSVVLRPSLNLLAGADLGDDSVFSFAVSFALPR